MRILELGKFYPPYRGGMETLLQSYCEGFVHRGGQVRCIVANDRNTSTQEELNGVEVWRCASMGSLFSTSLSPRYLTQALRFKADIWHVHFPNPLADLACLLHSKSSRVPVVVSYHSDIIRQTAVLWIYRFLLRHVFQKVAAITVATPNHLKYSSWLQSYRNKVHCIPFGIRLDKLKLDSDQEREAARLRETFRGQTLLLNIGRLVEYKGQEYLIRAMKDCPQASLWIIGIGPLEATLRGLAGDLGVSDRVHFTGEIEEDRLAVYLNACDIFVFPSVTPNEAFGLVQVEAMACGKPVISCDLPSGVPFVNRHGVTGKVIPPRDVRELALAIQELSSDPPLRHRYGQAAMARAHSEFSEPVMLDRYWTLFHDLVGAQSSA